MSALLFDIINVEKMIRDSGINREDTIFTKSHLQCLAYAGDVTFLVRSKKELQLLFVKLLKSAKRADLGVSYGKNKIHESGWKQ